MRLSPGLRCPRSDRRLVRRLRRTSPEHIRLLGGVRRPSVPEEPLESPTCVLTMSWDEQGRRAQGPGFGPLGNEREAPASIVPIRDLIEWTLLALGASGDPAQ